MHTHESSVASAPSSSGARLRPLFAAIAAGSIVAVAIVIYGRLHTPTGDVVTTFGFSNMLAAKAWLATAAAVLVVVQVVSALWMWGRLPFVTAPAGRAVARVHRWSGTAAFICSLPVAYHCLWAVGFQTSSARAAVHSVMGCAFYGAFTTKMLALRCDRLPRAVLPIVGALCAVVLVAAWSTSATWYFRTFGFPAT